MRTKVREKVPESGLKIGGVIAAAREKAGLSQRDLAERLRCPHSVVAEIETGGRQVKVPEFIELANAIGVDAEDLFRRVVGESLESHEPGTI